MNSDALAEELHRIEQRLVDLEEQRSRVARELAVESEKRELYVRLLALERHDSAPVAEKKTSFEDAVYRIISRNGKEMHLSEIRRALINEGTPIPGRGTDANIITRMSRDSRFGKSETRRGYYRLRV